MRTLTTTSLPILHCPWKESSCPRTGFSTRAVRRPCPALDYRTPGRCSRIDPVDAAGPYRDSHGESEDDPPQREMDLNEGVLAEVGDELTGTGFFRRQDEQCAGHASTTRRSAATRIVANHGADQTAPP